MDLENLNLSAEQMEKVKALVKDSEQVEFAKAEDGVELTDEQLEQVAGGATEEIHQHCPFCGEDYLLGTYDPSDLMGIVVQGTMTCTSCGRKFGYAFKM